MSVDDIAGTKSRRLIRGVVAKNILSNADIEGSSPKLDKVPTIYNCFSLNQSLMIFSIIVMSMGKRNSALLTETPSIRFISIQDQMEM